jgi:hypothetical protein
MVERSERDRAAETTEPYPRGDASAPIAVDRVPPRRQRRPTGAPAPLPKTIGVTGWLWVTAALVVVLLGSLWLYLSSGPLDRRFFALGNFGQYIYVAPDAGTVIVRNGAEWGVDNDAWLSVFREVADQLGRSS